MHAEKISKGNANEQSTATYVSDFCKPSHFLFKELGTHEFGEELGGGDVRREGIFSDSLSARLSDPRAGLPRDFDVLSRPWDNSLVGRTSSSWLIEVAGDDVMDEKLGETSRYGVEGRCASRVGV